VADVNNSCLAPLNDCKSPSVVEAIDLIVMRSQSLANLLNG